MKSLSQTGELNREVLRFVRCRRTGRYFKSGHWTRNCIEATTFSEVLEAVRVCARHRLRHVELALRVEGSASDLFRMPIR